MSDSFLPDHALAAARREIAALKSQLSETRDRAQREVKRLTESNEASAKRVRELEAQLGETSMRAQVAAPASAIAWRHVLAEGQPIAVLELGPIEGGLPVLLRVAPGTDFTRLVPVMNILRAAGTEIHLDPSAPGWTRPAPRVEPIAALPPATEPEGDAADEAPRARRTRAA